MRAAILLIALVMAGMAAPAQESEFSVKYPESRKANQVDLYYGTKVKDPYRWLEDDRSVETKEWVKKQNEITENYLNQIPYRDSIKSRLRELCNYTRYSAPFHEGEYTYFYKNEGLQNQSVLYRQSGNTDPVVFLDPNEFSTDGTTSLQDIEFTKDGSLAAYEMSEAGTDWRKVIILDTKTGKQIDDTLHNVKFSRLSWFHNDGFYYSSYDKPNGSVLSEKTDHHKLYFHKIGTRQSSDELIFSGEHAPHQYVQGTVHENSNLLVIYAVETSCQNKLYVQDLSMPGSPIEPLLTGLDYGQDVVFAKNGKLYMWTNQDAPNGKLVEVDVARPQKKHWKTVIPEGKFLLRTTFCGQSIFAHYVQNGRTKVYQYSMDGTMEHEIELPGLGTESGFTGKLDDTETYYTYTSYLSPPTIFRYNLKTGKSSVYKTSVVKFNPADYETKHTSYESKDGVKIPIFITYKKGLKQTSKNPVLLYGYGGFAISITPEFSATNILFLEHGGVYAVADLRGGGERGANWVNAGMRMNKQNVFDDFIAAANYLIEKKITDRGYIAIAGASNGGLLVGACIAQRPDLFTVCFPHAGVMDMLRYDKFTTAIGGSCQHGTAEESKEMFDYLFRYSPLHNVKPTCYPATLITTGDHDDRVVPAHSYKFAAALQANQECRNPTLIRIETNAGHGAGKSTNMFIAEQADKWAFLFWNMKYTYGDFINGKK